MIVVVSYIKKAQLLLEQRRPKEAESQLMQALSHDPQNDQALSLLARCKYDQRNYLEGIEIIQQAIAIYPTHDYYFYLMGFGYYQLGQTENAENALEQAVSLNPYASDYFGLQSMVMTERKKFAEALAKANEGLALDASNITCLNARSTALNKLRRTEDAIQTLQYALEQDPENDFTHTNAGWNLLEKGRHKEAAQHFMEALRLNPNLENARSGLKESLKSAIPPYRWLLQYSFWINNQAKKLRWIVPIGLYLIVRIISSLTSKAGDGWSYAGTIVVAAYLFLVFLSWVLNPLANFTLLFNTRGKHALTMREKWNSLLLVLCLLAASFLLCVGLLIHGNNIADSSYLYTSIILLTLSVPLGHMELPIQFRNNSRIQWYSIVLLLIGAVALVLSLISANAGFAGFVVYAVAFILYTWLSAFSNKV